MLDTVLTNLHVPYDLCVGNPISYLLFGGLLRDYEPLIQALPVAGGAGPGPGRPPAARRPHAGLRRDKEVTSYEALAKQSNMTESNLVKTIL